MFSIEWNFVWFRCKGTPSADSPNSNGSNSVASGSNNGGSAVSLPSLLERLQQQQSPGKLQPTAGAVTLNNNAPTAKLMVNSVNSNHNNNLNVQSINLAGLQGAVASLPLQSIQVQHSRTYSHEARRCVNAFSFLNPFPPEQVSIPGIATPFSLSVAVTSSSTQASTVRAARGSDLGANWFFWFCVSSSQRCRSRRRASWAASDWPLRSTPLPAHPSAFHSPYCRSIFAANCQNEWKSNDFLAHWKGQKMDLWTNAWFERHSLGRDVCRRKWTFPSKSASLTREEDLDCCFNGCSWTGLSSKNWRLESWNSRWFLCFWLAGVGRLWRLDSGISVLWKSHPISLVLISFHEFRRGCNGLRGQFDRQKTPLDVVHRTVLGSVVQSWNVPTSREVVVFTVNDSNEIVIRFVFMSLMEYHSNVETLFKFSKLDCSTYQDVAGVYWGWCDKVSFNFADSQFRRSSAAAWFDGQRRSSRNGCWWSGWIGFRRSTDPGDE